jgi:hypothetical protein
MVSIVRAIGMMGANACIAQNILFKHTPLHEQMSMRNAIVLMEVE